MLDSRFMPPPCLGTSDRNIYDRGCVVATKGKTTMFIFYDYEYRLHYVRCLVQLSVARNLIPVGGKHRSGPKVDYLS